jgi:hypothetical protein
MNRYFITLRWLIYCAASMVTFEVAAKNSKEMMTPPMACNDLVHISLDTLCYATIAPHMVLEDLVGSPYDYRIKVYYSNGNEQPDLNFDYSDINKVYSYKIWHLPSGNSCWGKVLIEDKFPPQMLCHNFTVRCGTSTDPFDLGFPISELYSVKIDNIGQNSYEVSGWDACTVVKLSYTDYLYNYQCDSLCFKKIVRNWTAVDEVGNSSHCSDTICILRPTEVDLVYPHHYDNFDLPHLTCDMNFPRLPNGNPSPDFTGWPVPNGCSTLTASYTDLKIATCGNTFKIIRRWIILNWCTGRLTEFNQSIKVADDRAPIFDCPKDITIGMQLYSCASDGKLPAPESVQDCNTWTYDVFSMTQDPITGNPNVKGKDYIVYDFNQKCFYLRGAPEGRIWIVYELTDACDNVSECTMEVGVVDNLAPIPICDQKTVVTLGADGTAKVLAQTFDDHSIDNCGIDSFLVRRMDDPCKNGTNVFGPYVRFCCADVGEVVMVALEVVDFYGNRNTCMIEATVQDKEPPVIIPPTDITVACDFPIDYTDLSVFGSVRYSEADRKKIIIKDPFYAYKNYVAGRDGLASDNCEVKFTENYIKDIKCNSGVIQRIFTAVDKQGLTSIAIQTITVVNTHPFTGNDIYWPPYLEIYSCNNVSTHPDQTGYPFYFNVNCAQIAANYTDTKLTVLDSTCFKILRKWYVIDWCQYDRNTNQGYWEYTQVIAVKNSEPPVIQSCTDVEICDQSSFYNVNTGQCMASYNLQGSGFDDCTEPQNLIWSYRIDENNDGSFGPVISGNVAAGVLPVGVHRLRWILTDQCGNISTCDQIFTLKDCKKPTPYCHNGVVTVVMPTSGNVTVWAKDLNLGSYDNCTSAKDLKFSFSPDVNDAFRVYNCDSLNRQQTVTKTVRMYVTDEYGNQDYCETTIRIQDNNHVCPGTNPGLNISGGIHRENQDALPGTNVNLNDPSGNSLDQTVTDNQGNYAFHNVVANDFYIKPEKTDNITNGVSTLDIVLIQRHILGIKSLVSPYKILAADVNGSNSVTVKDVSDLRKAILGAIVQFPNNTPIWKFVKADYQFANPTQPWDALTVINKDQLQDKLSQAHFIGIKTGDVDLSADVHFGNASISRTNNSMPWVYKIGNREAGNELEVEILSAEDMNLDGFQLGLLLDNDQWSIKEIKPASLDLSSDEYLLTDKQIKIATALTHSKLIKAGETMFSIVLNGNKSTLNKNSLLHTLTGFASEVYLNEQAHALLIRSEQENEKALSGLITYPAQPNPFSEESTIRFDLPGTANVSLQIYDLTGKRLFTKEYTCQKGRNELKMTKKDFRMNGLMYYVLTTPFGSASERMFVIE